MATLLAVYNEALSAAGAQGKLASTGDTSREAELCNLHYVRVRNSVFRAANWVSLKRTAQLALVAERDFSEDWTDGDPLPGWTYAYALPADYIRARYLADGLSFTLAKRGAELVLCTQASPAVLTYTYNETNPALWEGALYELVVARLARVIAKPLGADNETLGDVDAQWREIYVRALTESANEAQLPFPSSETFPDWFGQRDGWLEQRASPTFYAMPPEMLNA